MDLTFIDHFTVVTVELTAIILSALKLSHFVIKSQDTQASKPLEHEKELEKMRLAAELGEHERELALAREAREADDERRDIEREHELKLLHEQELQHQSLAVRVMRERFDSISKRRAEIEAELTALRERAANGAKAQNAINSCQEELTNLTNEIQATLQQLPKAT
jgi:hypothetical protein